MPMPEPGCLDSLRDEGVNVLLIDNGSWDASASLGSGVLSGLIRNFRNQGFGRAATLGKGEVQTEFALLLNTDVVLKPGAVLILCAAARSYPDTRPSRAKVAKVG